MKNLYKMTIAAVMAATMGAASALSVPGLPSGVDFQFSKPGVTVHADIVDTGGVTALVDITNILTAVGATGGTNINQDHFWKAMVDPTERNVFDYGVAKKYIDELVFTVQGEVERSNSATGWADATDDEITYLTGQPSTLNNGGNKIDGNLKETRIAATALLTMLGMQVATDSEGAVTISEISGAGEVTLADVKALALDETSAGIKAAVVNASLDKPGFENANKLIDMIALQLKTGFILNTENVTNSVEAIALQHNRFMAYSIVDKAKSLKDIIKAIGLEEAVVVLVKTGDANCLGTLGNNAQECVAIGTQVRDISTKLPVFGGTEADVYKTALVAITDLSEDVISFNGTVGQFDAASAATAIDTQFGTITVDTTVQFYTDLKTSAQSTIDAEFAAIGDSDDLFGTDFNESVTLDIIGTDTLGVETTTTKTINTH